MIKFTVNNGNLIRFFEKCAANGVVTITPTDKVKRNFFARFYVDAKDGKLYVTATDSGEQRMFVRHTLKSVEIEKEGKLGITDVETILEVLRAISKNRVISFVHDDEKRSVFVKTTDKGTFYGYRIRQTEPNEQTLIGLENSKVGVEDFERSFSFEEGRLKITTDQGSAFYDTIIRFKKTELSKVIRDSVKLTLDQDIKISIDNGKVTFQSGKKAGGVISLVVLDKEVENPIKVDDMIITNLHPIVDHLFSEFSFFCRIAGDKSLKYWIRSEEGDIELNFCSSSV